MQHLSKIRNLRRATKKQAGFTLVEIIVALIVIAIGIAIAIVAFGGAQESQRSVAAQQQILQLVAGIKKVYSGPNYTGLLATNIVNSGNVPSNMVSAGTIVNTFGGTVTLAAANVGTGGTGNGYAITYPLVGRAECNALAAGVKDTFKIITIGGTTVKNSVAATPVAYSETAVINACNNETNTFVLTGT